MKQYCEFKKTYTDENEKLLRKAFARLDGECYLDHAGTTLYSQDQIDDVFKDLSNNLYGNPHTTNLSSKLTKDAVDIVRLRILDRFNTNSEEYSVVFTSGATASLKTVAEYFDYSNGENNKNGTFVYLENNHTSVLGMREYAKSIRSISHKEVYQILSSNNVETTQNCKPTDNTNSLFVYPALCNFSGIKYPLSWITSVKNGALNQVSLNKSKHWYTLLDAAAYVPTNVLNLAKFKPDFVAISFYKMFGYPTGLGALLVKNSSKRTLVKKYYGGGTVLLAIGSENVHIPRTNFHERFEDGTLPFLSILAVGHGLKTMEKLKLNLYMISQHVFHLGQYLYRNLSVMHHSNGKRVVIIYRDTNYESCNDQGGIVTFNLLRPNGEYIGYSEVLHAANLYKIHLRTGCFCNPGACQRHLKLTVGDVYRHFEAGHVCGDQNDLIAGYPTGCVRASFGYMSTKEDVDKLLEMIKECFISQPVILKIPTHFEAPGLVERYLRTTEQANHDINHNETRSATGNSEVKSKLVQIYLYPVKSCAAFCPELDWEISSTGLRYDRQWMVVNASGVCVTQKQNKNLCKIKPVIDLKENSLMLTYAGFDPVVIPLNNKLEEKESAEICQSKICGKIIQGWDCGDAASNWLNTALNSEGYRLLRQFESIEESPHIRDRNDSKLSMSLANKAQYLLINIASVRWLRQKMSDDVIQEDLDTTVQRFRPNFVIDSDTAFIENKTKCFVFDKLQFEVTEKCTRCQMICVNQKTGDISKEPLIALSREKQGDISFGVYLKREHSSRDTKITIGAEVVSHLK